MKALYIGFINYRTEDDHNEFVYSIQHQTWEDVVQGVTEEIEYLIDIEHSTKVEYRIFVLKDWQMLGPVIIENGDPLEIMST